MAASRLKQRGERGRRGTGAAEEAGLVGNTWCARATEPRKPEATLELRRGARLGNGAGERERVRVRGEAAVMDAERSREAATSWLGEGATGGAADGALKAGAESEPASGGAAARPEPAGPITLERPCAMESPSAANTES